MVFIVPMVTNHTNIRVNLCIYVGTIYIRTEAGKLAAQLVLLLKFTQLAISKLAVHIDTTKLYIGSSNFLPTCHANKKKSCNAHFHSLNVQYWKTKNNSEKWSRENTSRKVKAVTLPRN